VSSIKELIVKIATFTENHGFNGRVMYSIADDAVFNFQESVTKWSSIKNLTNTKAYL